MRKLRYGFLHLRPPTPEQAAAGEMLHQPELVVLVGKDRAPVAIPLSQDDLENLAQRAVRFVVVMARQEHFPHSVIDAEAASPFLSMTLEQAFQLQREEALRNDG